MNKKEDVVEIDVIKLLKAVLRNIWAVILAAIICGTVSFAGSYFLIAPKYEASALLYVNNNNISVGSQDISISTSSLSAAQELVNTYIVILEARTTLVEVIDEAGVSHSPEDIRDMIEAAPVNSTEIFEIVVESTDPKEAENIANAITKVLPNRIAEIVDGSSVRIVDYAVEPSQRSSPSYTINTLLGMIIGAVLCVLVVVIREIYDVFIRDEQYLAETYDIPVLAAIPDASERSSGAYKYSYKSSYYYESTSNGEEKKNGK